MEDVSISCLPVFMSYDILSELEHNLNSNCKLQLIGLETEIELRRFSTNIEYYKTY